MKIFAQHLFFALLFCLSPQWLFAQQDSLPKEPKAFIEALSEMMAKAENPKAQKEGEAFRATWNSLSSAEKQQVIRTGRLMKAKNFYPYPNFTVWLHLMNSASGSRHRTDILSVAEKTLKNHKPQVFLNFCKRSGLLLDTAILYKGQFNAIQPHGGSLQFQYVKGKETAFDGGYTDQDQEAGKEQPTSGWGDWGSSGESDEKSGSGTKGPGSGWNASGGSDSGATPAPESGKGFDREQFEKRLAEELRRPMPMPEVQGPAIKFDNIDWRMLTRNGRAQIQNTSGTYLFKNDLFVGKGGKFTWRPAGIPEAYVIFSDYYFDVRNPSLKAKNVVFSWDEKLDTKVDGVFEYESQPHQGFDDMEYPRFTSYSASIKVPDLLSDMRYYGGFSLYGNQVGTNSMVGTENRVEILEDGQLKLEAWAKDFKLSKSELTSKNARITLYHDGDSITHPGMQLTYRDTNNYIRLMRSEGFFRNTPFYSSAFQMDIKAQAAKWALDSSRLHFFTLAGKKHVPVAYESVDFYNPGRFRMLGKHYRFHPVLLVADFSQKRNKMNFSAAALAQHYGQATKPVRAALQSLYQKGYLGYNEYTSEYQVRPKLIHYYKSYKKKKDYDHMAVISVDPERLTRNEGPRPGQARPVRPEGPNRLSEASADSAAAKPQKAQADKPSSPTTQPDSLGSSTPDSAQKQEKQKEYKPSPLQEYNSTFFLDSGFIKVRGVSEILLTDSNDVSFKPYRREVKLLPGRNMIFNGDVRAGIYKFEGRDFRFTYDDFKLNLAKVDSISFPATEDKLEQGEKENVTGSLYLGAPHNKSGQEDKPEYPKVDVDAESYKYFDKPSILSGAYNRQVYFRTDPFKMDSASSNDPQATSFDGTFISDQIFPEFRETLTIQPDKSLGFVHRVPAEGYQLYGLNGRFYGKLSMDKRGLRGDGRIEYLTTTVKSDDFIFYQDSVVANGPSAVVKAGKAQGTEFPDVTLKDYHMKWYTKKDSLCLYNKDEKPFQIYNNTATLDGQLVIGQKGARGAGSFKTRGAQVVTNHYRFKKNQFSGREAFFEVKSDDPLKPAVTSKNVKFDFFLDKGYAVFKPEEEGAASNEFPYMQYKTSIPKAVWDLNKKTVTMTKPEGAPLSASYFYSTNPEQDSLVFNATKAVYRIEKLALDIEGIPYIQVANSRVFPEDGFVEIRENAEIKALENAKILASSENKYHSLSQANIDIKSSHEFQGEAQYPYTDDNGDTTKLLLDNFAFPPHDNPEQEKFEHMVVGGGVVDQADQFNISPGVVFRGAVMMYSTKPHLEFNGEVSLDMQHVQNALWLPYTSDAESKDFRLDLAEIQANNENIDFSNGLHLDQYRQEIYLSFVSSKRAPDDPDLITTNGVMNYNTETDEFKIGPKKKLKGEQYEGSVIGYSDSTRHVSFEGPMNLVGEYDDFTFKSVGFGEGNIDSSTYRFDLMANMEMELPRGVLRDMAEQIKGEMEKMRAPPEATTDRDRLIRKIAHFAGGKYAQDYKERSRSEYVPTTDAVKAKGLFFSELNLKWSAEEKAWYSTGKLGLGHIGRTDLNIKVDGYLEIQKELESEVVNLLIKLTPDYWYYFSYRTKPETGNKELAVFTCSQEINETIGKKSDEDQVESGEYYFKLSDMVERSLFLEQFGKKYRGQKIEDNLAAPTNKGDQGGPGRQPQDPYAEPGQKPQGDDGQDQQGKPGQQPAKDQNQKPKEKEEEEEEAEGF